MILNNIVAYFIFLFPTLVLAQEQFTLEGKVTGLTSSKIYLTYTDDYGKYSLDSAALTSEGIFSFSSKVPHPVKATLYSKTDRWRSDFILEQGKTTLNGDKYGTVKINGGANQEAFEILQIKEKKDALYFKDLNQKFAIAQKQKDTAETLLIQQQWNSKLAENISANKDFVRNHGELYIVLEPLNALLTKNAVAYKEGLSLFNNLSPQIKSSKMGEQITDLLAKKKLTAIGEIFTDFEQPDRSGRKVKLSSVLGEKYTLVHFWMAGSPSGRKENIAILPIYEKYRSKGFSVVAVSFDEDRDEWLKAINIDKASWVQLSDLKGWNRNFVSNLYDINTLPQNFLLDSKGYIVAKNLFGDELSICIHDLMK
ncbi:TlpA disulfide reductase family protein [Sphingobacterium bambusae]|uniref:DUF4369 domain-containing protein n=1 Tax=Sphingobacterium bambusae TaxID=662858 RepID=A0ABW6BGZ2_9SPHI|nr:TlpA disulfide reductase family protein [Sphingobacterium bambusae]WPL49455.1 TlpA disulfide reductase family protein [Sphingobacterium bambusae]